LAISALALAVLNCSFSCLLKVLLITDHDRLQLQLSIFTVQAQIGHRTIKLKVKICLELATLESIEALICMAAGAVIE